MRVSYTVTVEVDDVSKAQRQVSDLYYVPGAGPEDDPQAFFRCWLEQLLSREVSENRVPLAISVTSRLTY